MATLPSPPTTDGHAPEKPSAFRPVTGSQAKALIEASGISPETLGARIQRLRVRQDLTVRDLADLAAVDKNTILRVERGLPTSRSTLVLISAALKTNIARLLMPPQEDSDVRVHDRRMDRWRRYAVTVAGGARNEGDDVIGEAPERRVVALDGEAGFINMLDCQPESGQMVSSVLELYAESPTRVHPGEEFVYCLHGTARVTVGGRAILLAEGESASFWATEPHTYGPAPEAVEREALPVRVLSVRLDTRPRG